MSENDSPPNREYVCTRCGERVRVEAFDHGGYPNGFHVACDCVTIDACPYEMTQAETPDSWRIRRPECCRGVDASDLEVIYGGGVADYRCPDCGATYRWDGSMAGFPEPDDAEGDEIDDNQGVLPT